MILCEITIVRASSDSLTSGCATRENPDRFAHPQAELLRASPLPLSGDGAIRDADVMGAALQAGMAHRDGLPGGGHGHQPAERVL